MGKILVITEKPSVGRDIARVLKCAGKGEGYLFSETYVISWAIGHLAELCEPDDYNPEYKKWRMEHLPILPETIRLKPSVKTVAQFNVLKKLMNGGETERIVCATDSGREGELIFRYIYRLTGCKKPFDRLWISSMTDAAIREGFKKLKPGSDYDPLYASARCRSDADWLVGINASRAYTLRYNTLLSVGRVQTPTLAIIVARQKEIDAFVPSDYYEISARLFAKDIEFMAKRFEYDNDSATLLRASHAACGSPRSSQRLEQEKHRPVANAPPAPPVLAKTHKITQKEHAESIMRELTPPPAQAAVISAESERKQKPPPLLYDLTELQRDANKKYGYTAQKTLDIAQGLYEKRKLITYPRTDSRHLSGDLVPKLGAIVKKLMGDKNYKPFAERLDKHEKLPITKRVVDDTKVSDHHAIIPTDTGVLNLALLTRDEQNIFDLAARRFLAVFFPNYIYDSTSIITDIAGHKFESKGTAVVSEGWMELYRNDEDAKNRDEDDNPVLPRLASGEMAKVLKIKSDKKRTKPPALYTESTLLSAMEHAGRFVTDEALKESLKESGLGTPATRASIIERLINVGYIRRKGKSLVPEEKGVLLIEAVPTELKSPETTGKWEKGLLSIAGKNLAAERFMQSIERYVRYIVEQAKTAAPKIAFPKEEKKWAKKSKIKR